MAAASGRASATWMRPVSLLGGDLVRRGVSGLLPRGADCSAPCDDRWHTASTSRCATRNCSAALVGMSSMMGAPGASSCGCPTPTRQQLTELVELVQPQRARRRQVRYPVPDDGLICALQSLISSPRPSSWFWWRAADGSSSTHCDAVAVEAWRHGGAAAVEAWMHGDFYACVVCFLCHVTI